MNNLTLLTNICAVDNDSDVVVDMYESLDENGNLKYIDEYSYLNNLKEARNMIKDTLSEIRDNNPLNKKQFDKTKTQKRFIVNLEKINNTLDGTYYTSSSGLITDYDGNSKFYKKDKKPRKYKFYKLKRLMCVFGVAFGITAAIKSATHYNVNSNGDIKVEKEDNKTNNINSNKKIEKSKEKKDSHKLRLGSKIKLNNSTLKYTSLGRNPFVNTRKLACDSYKINHIALTSDGNVIKVYKVTPQLEQMSINDFIQRCQVEYGDDLKFQINVDGIKNGKTVYKQAGWTSINEIKNKENKNYKVKTL
mgnify:CR=1 FL=1